MPYFFKEHFLSDPLRFCGFAFVASLSALLVSACADTDDPSRNIAGGEIRIVGSSTVYPFSTKVAQEFKNITGYNVVVESTGSGGGHKLFCEGTGTGTPDITNSSRRQKKSEFDLCQDNGVRDIIEVKIGFDGIVIANALDAPSIDLRLQDIFLALAKEVPISETNCRLHPNPYSRITFTNQWFIFTFFYHIDSIIFYFISHITLFYGLLNFRQTDT